MIKLFYTIGLVLVSLSIQATDLGLSYTLGSAMLNKHSVLFLETPLDFHLEAQTPTEVWLEWSPDYINEPSYKIDRYEQNNGLWVNTQTYITGESFLYIQALTPEAVYKYVLTAFDATGSSAPVSMVITQPGIIIEDVVIQMAPPVAIPQMENPPSNNTINIDNTDIVAIPNASDYPKNQMESLADFEAITKPIQALNVSPNPSTDYIVLQVNENTEKTVLVEMYNLTGQLIKKEKVCSQSDWYVGTFRDGMYLIRVLDDAGNILQRIEWVKQR